MRILLVEDEPAAARMLAKGLREQAYAVDVATDGREAAYPLWQLVLQVINHGTQHRAEAAAMLTELGASPGELDLIVFLRERRQAAGS